MCRSFFKQYNFSKPMDKTEFYLFVKYNRHFS